MKDLVELLTKSLVDNPSNVDVAETASDSVVVYEIHVAQDDVGKVIGKEGRIANAIRAIVKAAAAKQGKKVTNEIDTQ